MKQILTPANIKQFIGQTIRWEAERGSDNAEYGPYTGEAIIKSYDPNDHDHPIEAERICGDLFTAWQESDEFFSGGDYTYISVEVAEDDPNPAPANTRGYLVSVKTISNPEGRQEFGLFSGLRALKSRYGRIIGEDGKEVKSIEGVVRFSSPLHKREIYEAEPYPFENNEQDSLFKSLV